jgi:D-amino peptidase
VKVFVTVDLEGISGVYAEEQTDPAGAGYAASRQFMRADLDAVLEGCFEAGANEIVVNDSHDKGSNLSSAGLPAGVSLASGSPSSLSMMTGIDASFDAMLAIGYHACAGTAAAVLEHTYTYKIFSVAVDGQNVGELAINAAVAGSFGVPVVFVSGDDKVAKEAMAAVAGVHAAVVKYGDYRTSARLVAPTVAHERIRGGVAAALTAARPNVLDWRGKTLVVTFSRVSFADVVASCPGVRRLDGRTIAIGGSDYLTTFKTFVFCLQAATVAAPPVS